MGINPHCYGDYFPLKWGILPTPVKTVGKLYSDNQISTKQKEAYPGRSGAPLFYLYKDVLLYGTSISV